MDVMVFTGFPDGSSMTSRLYVQYGFRNTIDSERFFQGVSAIVQTPFENPSVVRTKAIYGAFPEHYYVIDAERKEDRYVRKATIIVVAIAFLTAISYNFV